MGPALLRRRALARLLAAVAMPLLVGAAAHGAPRAGEAQRLHALFDERWETDLRRHPEWATWVGDHRYGDRLFDATPETEAAETADLRRWLARAQAVRRAALPPVDRVSLDVFVHQLQDELALRPFSGFRSLSMDSQGGFQSALADLLRTSPVAQRAQVEQMLARMAAYPRRVRQELQRLRAGAAQGWVPPLTVLDRVLAQIDAQLGADGDRSPFFAPFLELGSDIPAAERAALQARARERIGQQVLPALRQLRAFVADEYRPASLRLGTTGAMSAYPGGAEVYARLVRRHTTTSLAAAEVHALGLREVARLRREMEAVPREMGFDGDFAAFVKHLNTDPRYFADSAEALMAVWRDVAKRIDPELPRLFTELPRTPYGLRAMPLHFAPDTAPNYEGPPLDGSRPGWINVNAHGYRTSPLWEVETTVAHEAVPGHHLQIARAVELTGLPRFRRSGGFTAYDEGWALYAETLGFELGLYRDPPSRFGHLQWQAFRAARLVVDTGLHAQGWTRQQAIDYLAERTGVDRAYVTAEVDRYLSDPGQALAYTVGQLKIIELRDRARAALGERFDIRRFHQVVLDQGPLPLTVLERVVDAWLKQAAGARR
ncbi:MAG: hypothetical protein RJA10_3981 [Pseudomonadota bacterium]|jgi:uncharacterized protein (DUF885 family)